MMGKLELGRSSQTILIFSTRLFRYDWEARPRSRARAADSELPLLASVAPAEKGKGTRATLVGIHGFEETLVGNRSNDNMMPFHVLPEVSVYAKAGGNPIEVIHIESKSIEGERHGPDGDPGSNKSFTGQRGLVSKAVEASVGLRGTFKI